MLDYKNRRQQLQDCLPPNAVAIIPAAKETLRNGDAHYRFRQDSYFYYLTGFDEPDACLVLLNEPHPRAILFNRPREKQAEIWTGRRLGQEDAITTLMVDEAYQIDELPLKLSELLANRETLFFDLNHHPSFDEMVLDSLSLLRYQSRRGVKAPTAIMSINERISEMRLIKSEEECRLIQKAVDISVEAHLAAIKACNQLQYEYEIEGLMVGHFLKKGCRSVAYDTIAGSGPNACILHYTANNAPLVAGDLILVDAGGEYQNYAADLTRTYPVSGQFSPPQRALYEVVLRAQRNAIALIKPGLKWHEIQEALVWTLTEGLIALGILQGDLEALVLAEAYKPYYMHSSGHWLGLDVHDVGHYKVDGDWRELAPGMVLTVEPGLYISPDAMEVSPLYRGMGIRIEDDILVTTDGCEILSKQLPVTCDEIEALMRG